MLLSKVEGKYLVYGLDLLLLLRWLWALLDFAGGVLEGLYSVSGFSFVVLKVVVTVFVCNVLPLGWRCGVWWRPLYLESLPTMRSDFW